MKRNLRNRRQPIIEISPLKNLIRNVFERLLAPVAWGISRVRINRISFEKIDGQEYVLKKRSLISPVLIVIGNCVLSLRHVPVKVLHYREWIDWDRRIQAAVTSPASQETSQGLLVPRKLGRPISDLIRLNAIEDERIIEVFSLALRELYRLHQLSVEVVTGVEAKFAYFSHGDASVSNVLFDVDSDQACWFDFDLRHDFRRSATLRHADDLRAFLFTAMKCLSKKDSTEELNQRFKQAMRLAYPAEQVWQSLDDITNSYWLAMDLFHRAQLFRLRD